jgi:hypothetical protein
MENTPKISGLRFAILDYFDLLGKSLRVTGVECVTAFASLSLFRRTSACLEGHPLDMFSYSSYPPWVRIAMGVRICWPR